MKDINFKKFLVDNEIMDFNFDITKGKIIKKNKEEKNKNKKHNKQIKEILKLSGIKKTVDETRGDENDYDYGTTPIRKKVKKQIIDAFTFSGGLTPEFKISKPGDNPLKNILDYKLKKNDQRR